MVTDKMVQAAARILQVQDVDRCDRSGPLDAYFDDARAVLEAALSASDAEPVCTVAEICAGGYRMLAPYPLDAISHLPVGTPLYATPPADTSPVVPEGWLDISTAPKNMKVLAAYRNENGKWRIITACYHTELPWSDDDDRDDDEAEYAPEGWYEESDSSEVSYPTSSKPTHWQPLPAPPVYVAAPKEASHE